uniref:Uncharacterized protein n=1 Tax=Oryza glumipatula TaxID=40148 RepID=A0A0D9YBI8_9ORYZ
MTALCSLVPPRANHAPISNGRRAVRLRNSHAAARSHPSFVFPPPPVLLSFKVNEPKAKAGCAAVSPSSTFCRRTIAPAGSPLTDHVEDPTGLAGIEVDLEGYTEASEGHVPGFGQVDMIRNGGTRESSDRLALLRPSKCPTARTDQYPTGQ